MPRNSPEEQLRSMVDHILGSTVQDGVAAKMAGDLADLACKIGNVAELKRLLLSDNHVAQAVAASALHLCGSLANAAGPDVARLLDHPNDYVRRLGKELLRQSDLKETE